MPHCGFCGKLCPTMPGLKRHINGNPAPDSGEGPELDHPIEPIQLDLPDIHQMSTHHNPMNLV